MRGADTDEAAQCQLTRGGSTSASPRRFGQPEGWRGDLVERAARFARIVEGPAPSHEQVAPESCVVGGHGLLNDERTVQQPGCFSVGVHRLWPEPQHGDCTSELCRDRPSRQNGRSARPVRRRGRLLAGRTAPRAPAPRVSASARRSAAGGPRTASRGTGRAPSEVHIANSSVLVHDCRRLGLGQGGGQRRSVDRSPPGSCSA